MISAEPLVPYERVAVHRLGALKNEDEQLPYSLAFSIRNIHTTCSCNYYL